MEALSYRKELRRSLAATLFSVLLLCGLYPLAVWSMGRALFRPQAEGSLIADADGAVIGSFLLGQSFSSPKYFHPRPSAAGSGYDAAASGGSNLGPTSQKLADSVKARVEAYRKDNGLAADALIPVDAVTASGSGLDPEISLANALLQAPRVAKERGLPLERVTDRIDRCLRGRTLGFLGEPGVNVLRLNLSLDETK